MDELVACGRGGRVALIEGENVGFVCWKSVEVEDVAVVMAADEVAKGEEVETACEWDPLGLEERRRPKEVARLERGRLPCMPRLRRPEGCWL
jgi:hypothetical protein